ncbi:MAG: energy transducer TonB [Verrucomicrobiae bacterium]|nr:energy transducer TonB [Verrucomicrobiae bacterium]MCX7722339.1 energy transducer TonB [Verrucomicrobiae bacterium]MDW7979098.1 energy transducer TonB [Verrucomicrobiales bacterium]
MSRVYTPLPSRTNPLWPTLGALGLTLAVFLVLPLTQMVSSGVKRQLVLRKVDSVQLEAPPPETDAPPPPPPEDKTEPPPPVLTDTPPPMQLHIDLEIAVGAGGALPGYAMIAAEHDVGAAVEVFNVADVEKQPELISSVPPRYPPELRKARVEGLVTLVFVVDETGRVVDARVESSTRPEFERPALEAIRNWKFRPAQKNGESVRCYVRLPIRFRINT